MTKKQKKVLYRIIISAVLLAGLMILTPRIGIENKWILLVLYLVPYMIIGYDILRKAALGIYHREVFDENFLMAVATVGALVLGVWKTGDFEESVAVMLFYQIGELFQSCAVGKSRKNITALMDIRPDYANVEGENGLEQVDPEDVEVGTVIIVQPGEKVPIDGTIVEGVSTLNTSALTGESLPREVKAGDEVISGCVNMSGLLKVKTTKEFGESTVSKILDLVENSSMKKAKSENFISKFAKVYTPLVCFAAVAVAVLPPVVNQFILHQAPAWENWIQNALSFLVVSCPCALVISVPLSFFGGIGGASARGILIKGSNYLETLAKVKYMVFDKTGTLTQGVFQVTEICPVGSMTQEDLLSYAAQVESYSNHPISRSLREAYGKEIDNSQISDVEEISGHGVTACVNGMKVAAGNQKLMKQLQLEYSEPQQVGTVVYVAVDGQYAGYILINDVVKENSKKAIAGLKSAGVKKTVMLTGDSRPVAESIAKELNVDEVYSELLPADKVEQVEALLAKKDDAEKLAFVGDGINDAPVLSRADIGIAMGAMGSDAAIEAADVVLMDDDPAKIALAMKISRKTLGIVYQNIVFALAVKIICLLLIAFAGLGMWLAILADVGVMVLAVLNATRALYTKRLAA
ncbi:MAG: cadmium-translocating P-type ATPase [Lachnospiraceae bacterium]|nr:cadmium-translocating P-type ATPase [Lachnospiraceae bacterium]